MAQNTNMLPLVSRMNELGDVGAAGETCCMSSVCHTGSELPIFQLSKKSAGNSHKSTLHPASYQLLEGIAAHSP